MLGLGQAPFLSALAKHGFQPLAQALLIALQLRHQAAAVFQFASGRQAGQLRGQLLLALLQCIGTLGEGLQVLALPLFAALQLAHLQDAPATHGDPGGAHEQGQQCQAIAGASGGRGGGSLRRVGRRGLFCVGQDSFAHVSILCMVAHRSLA